MRANAINLQSGRGAGVAAGLVLLLTISSGAAAVTFTVTRTTDDSGPCEPDDCSLREAIIAANASPGPDSIILPGGTYTLSIPGADENASMTGDLDVRGDLEILNFDVEIIALAGAVIDAQGIDRVFRFLNSSRSRNQKVPDRGSHRRCSPPVRDPKIWYAPRRGRPVALGRLDVVHSVPTEVRIGHRRGPPGQTPSSG